MKKRLAYSLIIILVFSMLGSGVFAASLSSYVALGDSITTGYGLEGYAAKPSPFAKDSYVNLFSKKANLTPINFAVDGRTSYGLAKSLSNPTAELKSQLQAAGVISITTGGNDLLKAFYLVLGEKLGIDTTQSGYKGQIARKVTLAAVTNNQSILSLVSGAAGEFSESVVDLSKLFERNILSCIFSIKKLNPNAIIIIQTIPNPYKDMSLSPELDLAFAKATKEFNSVIVNKKSSSGYIVSDTFTAFLSSNVLSNATSASTPLDPHPNKEGHALIADTLYETYTSVPVQDQMVAPKLQDLLRKQAIELKLKYDLQ